MSREQGVPVTIETVSIWNRLYLVADDWGGVPLNRKGEDINSQTYGGPHFRPTSAKTSMKDERLTIGLEHMEIGIHLTNNTNEEFSIDAVILQIEKIHSTDELALEKGNWDLDAGFGIFCQVDFEIDQNLTGSLKTLDDTNLSSNEQEGGSRINVSVSTSDLAMEKGVIIEFSLIIKFSTTGSKLEHYQIASDKNYFIGAI